MKTKYDWSGVPLEYNWIATDLDGVANAFYNKPNNENHDMWFDGDDYFQIGTSSFKGNWQDSLEERPND